MFFTMLLLLLHVVAAACSATAQLIKMNNSITGPQVTISLISLHIWKTTRPEKYIQ